RGGGAVDAVGVVQQHAQVADAAHAGLRAHGRLACLDARETERALLGLAALPVVVHLLVGASRDAHAPAAAFVLVDQHDAVVLALVDRARRATGHAGRVQAVLAQARQVHHEGVLERRVHFLLHAFEQRIATARAELAAQVVFPVRAPVDLLHFLAGQHGHGARGRRRLAQLGLQQVFVVVRERLVVVVDGGQVGVGEQVGQDLQLATLARFELAGAVARPAAVPARLVFPFLRVADARLGLDVVEPRILDAGAAGPHVLAGHGAGMAADALVQVQHHTDLGTDLHFALPFSSCGWPSGPSIQSTLFILRTTTYSSRLLPTVP